MNLQETTRVKEEKRDDQEEIDQLAAKMVEANKAKLATATPSSASGAGCAVPRAGQQSLLNYFSRSLNQGPGTGKENPAEHPVVNDSLPCDEESAKGRFGWTEGPLLVPYIFRGKEKYCSVRMFEQRALKSFANLLRAELCSCVNIPSYYITDVESRLLNEINVKHCEYQFGRDAFTVRDVIVRLSDALEFHTFLQVCQNKLSRKSCDPSDRCGFFRIAGESVVPYTMVGGAKHVPLFYFEGEMGNLDKKSVKISGWDLAYLKLCCKVQGIRDELFANDVYPGVSIEDIRPQFPANTDLQLYWPSRSQFDKINSSSNSSCTWFRKPAGNPPPLPTALQQPTASVIQKTPSAVVRPPVTSTLPVPTVPSSRSAGSSTNPMDRWHPHSGYPAQSSMNSSSRSTTSRSADQSVAASQLVSALATPSRSAAVAQGMNIGMASGLNAVAASYMAAILEYQSRQNSVAAAQQAASQTVRSSGVPPDNYRSSYVPHSSAAAPSTSMGVANRPPYSTSQSPLTGIVPGSSPHSRSGAAGASPRPGNPVPTSGLHSVASTGAPKPPPPLIPVNGSSMYAPMHTMMTSPTRSAALSLHHQTQQHRQALRSPPGLFPPAQQHQHQQQQQQQEPPFRVQRLPIENHLIPCVNSRQYVFNNLMMALPDMAAYLFPHLSHHACKQVLHDGLGITLYEANPQQLQALTSDGKVSAVSSVRGERVYLVNVRDVIQFMPQIKYMVSRLDSSDFGRALHTKRQRVS